MPCLHFTLIYQISDHSTHTRTHTHTHTHQNAAHSRWLCKHCVSCSLALPMAPHGDNDKTLQCLSTSPKHCTHQPHPTSEMRVCLCAFVCDNVCIVCLCVSVCWCVRMHLLCGCAVHPGRARHVYSSAHSQQQKAGQLVHKCTEAYLSRSAPREAQTPATTAYQVRLRENKFSSHSN